MRNNRFAIMKGLAITGVVVGHAGIDTLELFVNYWHLPVFFYVSGYFLKEKHLNAGKDYILQRFKRLIIPFLIFGTIALLMHNLLINASVINGDSYGMSETIRNFAKLCLLFSSNEELIGAMWFLPALFIMSILGWTIVKLSKKYRKVSYLSFASMRFQI